MKIAVINEGKLILKQSNKFVPSVNDFIEIEEALYRIFSRFAWPPSWFRQVQIGSDVDVVLLVRKLPKV